MLNITLYVLCIGLFSLMWLVFKDPKIMDKLLFMNLIIVKLALAMAVYAVMVGSQMILEVCMTYSIIGFLATALVIRFVLKGEHQK